MLTKPSLQPPKFAVEFSPAHPRPQNQPESRDRNRPLYISVRCSIMQKQSLPHHQQHPVMQHIHKMNRNGNWAFKQSESEKVKSIFKFTAQGLDSMEVLYKCLMNVPATTQDSEPCSNVTSLETLSSLRLLLCTLACDLRLSAQSVHCGNSVLTVEPYARGRFLPLLCLKLCAFGHSFLSSLVWKSGIIINCVQRVQKHHGVFITVVTS